jgi:hypothetical protein
MVSFEEPALSAGVVKERILLRSNAFAFELRRNYIPTKPYHLLLAVGRSRRTARLSARNEFTLEFKPASGA